MVDSGHCGRCGGCRCVLPVYSAVGLSMCSTRSYVLSMLLIRELLQKVWFRVSHPVLHMQLAGTVAGTVAVTQSYRHSSQWLVSAFLPQMLDPTVLPNWHAAINSQQIIISARHIHQSLSVRTSCSEGRSTLHVLHCCKTSTGWWSHRATKGGTKWLASHPQHTITHDPSRAALWLCQPTTSKSHSAPSELYFA